MILIGRLQPAGLTNLQFRAKWIPSQETCVMIHMESIKLSTIVALTTDIGLILIMLLGLLRLRRRGGGIMALGRLLWNQVGLWHFFLSILLSIRLCISVHKGIIWLLLATAAGVTPTVVLSHFFRLTLLLITTFLVGVHLFAFEC